VIGKRPGQVAAVAGMVEVEQITGRPVRRGGATQDLFKCRLKRKASENGRFPAGQILEAGATH
jgi:hypothetical protein